LRIYLSAEIKFLADRRKIREVEILSGVRLGDLDVVVRHFLLRDYMRCDAAGDALEIVLKRCRVLDRVTEIVRTCPGAHPEAAFEFCVDHPHAGAEEFRELKEKMQRVFRLEGARILDALPIHCRRLLTETVLKDEYEDLRFQDRKAIVRRHLLSVVNEQTADMIMNHPVCRRHLDAGCDESKIAANLMNFWRTKDDKRGRMRDLVAAFRFRRLRVPVRSECFKQYVNSETDFDVHEAVHLFDRFRELSRSYAEAIRVNQFPYN